MAKKIPININSGALAEGFFSTASKQQDTVKEAPAKATVSSTAAPKKNKGGRPRKEKKKQQYTLTMDPELYQQLRETASSMQKSFSQLVTDVMIDYLDKV